MSEPIKSKLALTITSLGEVKKIGDKGAEKFSFKAKGADGKELWYFSFRASLFEALRANTNIEVDLETTTREVDGNTYTDRKVTQIYVDGKPVAEDKQGSFGGGRPWQPQGKSPEERRSIERQKSLDLACQRSLTTSTTKQVLALADEFFDWIHGKDATVAPLPKVPPSAPDAKPSVPIPPAVSGPDLLKRFTAVAEEALVKGFTAEQVIAAFARQKPPIKVTAVNELGAPDFTVMPQGLTEAGLKPIEVQVSGAERQP